MTPRTTSRILLLFFALSFALLFVAGSSQALMIEVDGSSLHGATGSLTINDNGGGSYDVAWSMDFSGYQGSAGNHQYLTEIAFKAFSSVSMVSLDSISWNPATSGTVYYPSNVNNGGCVLPGDPGSNAGMVCVDLNPEVDATMGGEITANFTVKGDLKEGEWSYRGRFGPENGWVISESANPIPEPSAALLFGIGSVVFAGGLRRRNLN